MADKIYWALCPWFEESGNHLIHPDDLSCILKFQPYGKVFQLGGKDGVYTKIFYGGQVFRVRKKILRLLKPKKRWLFDIGETVSIKGRDCSGVVVDINWHYKEEKPMYMLKVGDKLKSKRYWPEDIANMGS